MVASSAQQNRHDVFRARKNVQTARLCANVAGTVGAKRNMGSNHQSIMDAVEGMSDAFALFDPEDRLVYCNEKFKALNPELAAQFVPGVTFEELLRDNLENGRILDAVGCKEEFMRERMARHSDPGEPILSHRNDGRWLLVKEERTPDGSTFLINTDLTKFKQHDDALQRAKEMAERANGFKSEFLAKMSHELRTPLNAIIGFSDILKSELFGPLGNAKYSAYARDIYSSGKYLLDLIDDVLDLSKIEAGKYALQIEEIDLGAVTRGVERLIRGQTDEKNIHLGISVDCCLPSIHADERAIRQILLNLLSNAVKFTPEGGCIQVQVSQGRYGDVCIVVKDSGIGIPKEKIQTILDPFVQVSVDDRSNGGGVGLGLPIVNSLTQLHGGTLEVTSKYGEWTCITVRLPKECVVPEKQA